VHTGLSSKEVVHKYQLGTSANVLKIKKVLLQKEFIDDQAGIYFLDPVYELWFKKICCIKKKNLISPHLPEPGLQKRVGLETEIS
jgi:hypothetical protein